MRLFNSGVALLLAATWHGRVVTALPRPQDSTTTTTSVDPSAAVPTGSPGGAYTPCHNIDGPFAPFCNPSDGKELYVGEVYYSTCPSPSPCHPSPFTTHANIPPLHSNMGHRLPPLQPQHHPQARRQLPQRYLHLRLHRLHQRPHLRLLGLHRLAHPILLPRLRHVQQQRHPLPDHPVRPPSHGPDRPAPLPAWPIATTTDAGPQGSRFIYCSSGRGGVYPRLCRRRLLLESEAEDDRAWECHGEEEGVRRAEES
jgi:hypothetical protein